MTKRKNAPRRSAPRKKRGRGVKEKVLHNVLTQHLERIQASNEPPTTTILMPHAEAINRNLNPDYLWPTDPHLYIKKQTRMRDYNSLPSSQKMQMYFTGALGSATPTNKIYMTPYRQNMLSLGLGLGAFGLGGLYAATRKKKNKKKEGSGRRSRGC